MILERLAKVTLPQTIPGVSLAIIDKRRIEWAGGLGVREAGRSDPVTADTLFQACSVSKAVTAVAVLRLAQEGRLNLDQDVNDHLTSWQVPVGSSGSSQHAGVTARQLLSHIAGVNLPWSAGYHREQEIPTLLEVLNGEKPSIYPAIEVTSPPGLGFHYSGGGYCILQQLLIDLVGKPFPELMRELVFDPLDMKQSTFEQPLPKTLWDSAASGHRASGKPVAGKWHVYPEMALGGLWTTPSDLARLALGLGRALAGQSDTLLSTETVREMLTPQVEAGDRGRVGLGVFIEGPGAGSSFGHPGDNEGYTARWISLMDGERGAVIMTNSDVGWVIQEEMLGIIAEAYDWRDYRGRSIV